MRRHARPLAMLFFIAALGIGFGLTTQGFLSPENMSNLVRHTTEVGLVSLAMTGVMISGGIDLSVGSIVALSAVILGAVWRGTESLPLALSASLAVGLLAGLLNGVAVAVLRIPALLVTLATLSAYRGLAMGISEARPVHHYPDLFLVLGQGHVGPFPIQLFIFAPACVLAWLLLGHTPMGKHVYLIGCGEKLAKYTGVPVRRRLLMLYVWSGLAAALAGLLFVARVSTAKADAGTGLELNAITAVVVGGTSISGGSGTVTGTLLGLILIKLLDNGMSLNNVPSEWRTIAIGLLLLLSATSEGTILWMRRRMKR